jgi:hypothetical protein
MREATRLDTQGPADDDRPHHTRLASRLPSVCTRTRADTDGSALCSPHTHESLRDVSPNTRIPSLFPTITLFTTVPPPPRLMPTVLFATRQPVSTTAPPTSRSPTPSVLTTTRSRKVW